mmetsp:Transcript_69902/g.111156  ORF Transcript_69902/g.111156 Transcript_69902/m.111156 type:complete len:223 (-) Transcript_69902:415-1083(-)
MGVWQLEIVRRPMYFVLLHEVYIFLVWIALLVEFTGFPDELIKERLIDNKHVFVVALFEHAEICEGKEDILDLEGGVVREHLQREQLFLLSHVILVDDFEELRGPKLAIRDESQVRERRFRRSQFALNLAESVRQRDHEMAQSFALMARQRHNARQIEVFLGTLFFGEIAQKMASTARYFRDDVKVKRGGVVFQRLVIEKELGQIRDILAVIALFGAVHLIH